MIIPIPLCAFHCNGYSGNDSYGQKRLIRAAFIGWNDTREVETSYVKEGARIRNQTGRYGAAINDESFDIFRIEDGDAVYNGASPTCMRLPAHISSASASYLIPCAASWFDGSHYWVAYGTVRANAERQRDDYGTWVYRLHKQDSTTGVSISAAYRLSADDLGQVVEMYSTAKQWSWPQRRVYLNSSSTKLFQIGDDVWREDLRKAYDASEIESAFSGAARYLAMEGIRKTESPYPAPVYSLGGFDPYPALKAIPTLLNTFEFSDPQLAHGSVGATTHYASRIIDQRTAWDNIRRRKGSEKEKQVLVLRGGPYGTYLFEWLVQHAWMDAANSIPQANQNSLQNLLAAFQLLMDIKNGNVAEIPDILYDEWVAWTSSGKAYAKGVSNLWLRYRYEVTTTNMDIQSYIDFGLNVVDKYMNQITSSRTHGSATYRDGDREYKCTCSMTWQERGLTGLSRFFHTIWQSGLEPNSYVLWDFVPFSFIADWFVPAGDVFEIYSSMQYRNTQYYDFSDIVFSIRYSTGPIAGLTASHYVRWVADSPPVVDESYWFDKGGASTSSKTVFKRVLDSGSLLTGMCWK